MTLISPCVQPWDPETNTSSAWAAKHTFHSACMIYFGRVMFSTVLLVLNTWLTRKVARVGLEDDEECDGHWWSWSGLSACPVMISSDKTTHVAPSQSERKKERRVILSVLTSRQHGVSVLSSVCVLCCPSLSSDSSSRVVFEVNHSPHLSPLTHGARSQPENTTSTHPWCTADGNSVCLRCCRRWHDDLITISGLPFLITVKQGLICIWFLNMHDGM